MLKKMNIKKRLTLSFILISSIISIVAVASCIAMIYISGQYAFALKNYGFSQGDIGNARLALSEARSATRQIISYADCVLAFWDGQSRGTKFVIEQCKNQHKKITVYVKHTV